MSADGRRGLTVIALIGNVFSPYYAAARRRGCADPFDHVAINVCLYDGRGRRWALTERRRCALRRNQTALTIGPSSLWWDGKGLNIEIDEITAPFPARIRGRIQVRPDAVTSSAYRLDAGGRHRWWPLAPSATVEVVFDKPSVRWRGHGYVDSNAGDVALEHDFVRWDWSRAPTSTGASVLYDITPRLGEPALLAVAFDRHGTPTAMEAPPRAMLPKTLWRLARATRCDAGAEARVARTLEDGPFYARSIVSARVSGESVIAVHESLCLDRFRSRWVQLLLPFRMPRTLGRAV